MNYSLNILTIQVEERDAELVIFLSSLQLDEVPQPGDHLSLPQQGRNDLFMMRRRIFLLNCFFQLIECAAAVSVKGDSDDDGGGGVTRELKEAMARIASISADVESSISEMREDLKVRKMFNPTEGPADEHDQINP